MQLFNCHRVFNLILFAFTFLIVPLVTSLIANEFERNSIQFDNFALSATGVVTSMLTCLLIYIVYMIGKPQHFT